MPKIILHFHERETLPDLLASRASELELTVEQLVKRFIYEGMQDYQSTGGPCVPGDNLDDFFVKNGVLKPKSDPAEPDLFLSRKD